MYTWRQYRQEVQRPGRKLGKALSEFYREVRQGPRHWDNGDLAILFVLSIVYGIAFFPWVLRLTFKYLFQI
jgi:hypothetical protein